MHLRIITVGRLREAYLAAAAADFRRRLAPYHRLEELEIRAGDGARPDAAIENEGVAILKALVPNDHVWLLDRRGTQFTSTELAERLQRFAGEGIARVTFVIAGTYGASQALLARADVRWSLSRLTFLHEWARVIVLEQLYRATKIAKDEPYHH